MVTAVEDRHPWCARLLAPLSASAVSEPIAPDHPLWEAVETQTVKLGSLAHGQVDLAALAEQCLSLLEGHSKDMRILVQLLRCLQQPARADTLALALVLLETWLDAYWSQAWPAPAAHKLRLLQPIVKRFEATAPRLAEQASLAELGHLRQLSESLALRGQTWWSAQPDLLDGWLSLLRRSELARAERHPAPPVEVAASAPPTAAAASESPQAQPPLPVVDTSSERGWRQTQLKVAALLIEQQPELPIGYRLRRHALWSSITTAPATNAAGRTQLAAVAADRVEEYQAALPQADLSLWQRIEQSLCLAPFWFEGHWLSAQVAEQLGQGAVASAIAEELAALLGRLPALSSLHFSDGTPFLPPHCQRWLSQGEPHMTAESDGLETALQACCDERGLAAALAWLDEQLAVLQEPRSRFLAQLAQADLLDSVGLALLAAQQFRQLWQETQRLGLAQWEPGLVNRLAHKVNTGITSESRS
ncbi:type VI secretion system protein TssA [Pseudaeromonas paramecii]|uniref:Type VI secretion system protein TssA n=1 Tax=Pseudaeromonas paramecii TaxID=2138166 RepID=A0ABP8Q4E3_9GAMM